MKKLIIFLFLAALLAGGAIALAQTVTPTAAPAVTAAPVVDPSNGPGLPTSGTWGWVVTILLAFNVILSALVKVIEAIAVKTASTSDDKAASLLSKIAGWIVWLLRIIGAAPSTPTVLRK